jgi:predicted alpha/beta-hydrolase family hydrolase
MRDVTAPRLSSIEPFEDASAGPAVRGFLHRPAGPPRRGLVLTHGAGSDCEAPLLLAVADAFARAGFTVLRCDLPFRHARAVGPPSPAGAARDRAGLRRAVSALQSLVRGRVSLGGHSYGGRQASILLAEEPALAEALLLLAYPLHPPRRPDHWRTGHFPALRTSALFVHGSRDPFGSLRELGEARRLIPARTVLVPVDGAGHDLARGRIPVTPVVEAFRGLFPD